MPQSPEDNEQSAVQQAADQHAEEILGRRREGRQKRAGPLWLLILVRSRFELKSHARLSLRAVAPAAASTTTAQTAGYLLAVGDSWFDYPIHDVLTRLDDNYGYNIESSAHRGDPIEEHGVERGATG